MLTVTSRVDATTVESLASAIADSDLFIVFASGPKSVERFQRFEASRVLERAWANPLVRVAVIAPAVGAIPTSLRNKPFVFYFPADEVEVDKWAAEPTRVDAFVDEILGEQHARSDKAGDRRPLLPDDVRRWRDRIVHQGGVPAVSSEDREWLLAVLNAGLDPIAYEGASVDTAQLLDRTLLAAALGDQPLASKYYQLLQRSASGDSHRAAASPTAAQLYALGIAALEVHDFESAYTNLLRSSQSESSPTSGALRVAALYNAALAAREMGKNDDALSLLDQAVMLSSKTLGPHHPQTAAAEHNLAKLLVASGKTEEAIRLLQLAQETYEKVDSPVLAEVTDELHRLGA